MKEKSGTLRENHIPINFLTLEFKITSLLKNISPQKTLQGLAISLIVNLFNWSLVKVSSQPKINNPQHANIGADDSIRTKANPIDSDKLQRRFRPKNLQVIR